MKRFATVRSSSELCRGSLNLELLEDRLAPNNMLGLVEEWATSLAGNIVPGWMAVAREGDQALAAPIALTSRVSPPEPQSLSDLAGSPVGASATDHTSAMVLLAVLPSATDDLLATLGAVDEAMGGAGTRDGGNPRYLAAAFSPVWSDVRPVGRAVVAHSVLDPVVNGHHPLIDGGAFGGQHHVLFLAGVGGGDPINLTIRPGTALFFPVINAECSVIEPPPFHGDNPQELRACANHHINHTSERFAVIDGRPVNHLDRYRVQSPLFVFGPLPEGNLLQFFGVEAPAGSTSPSVDAGYYLFLAPLRVGTHTLHFGGTFDELGFSIDTTYSITVAPH